jgi:putative drug exporter of the RND superfamily
VALRAPSAPGRPAAPRGPRPTAGWLARGYAFVVVSLRWLIIGGWAAGVAAAIVFLPPLNATSSSTLSELIPPGSPAARAEADVTRLFGFPLDAAVAVVQRDPHGMPTATMYRAVHQAISVDQQLTGVSGQVVQDAGAAAAQALAKADLPDAAQVLASPVSPGPPGGIPGLAGAFPLPNTSGLLHGTGEQSTTVITFLYFRPSTSFAGQVAGAQAYVRWFLNRPGDDVVGVTGPVPAEYAQSQIIQNDLFWVELLTVLVIAVIVGLRFRTVGAPLTALACAGTAYVLTVRAVAWLATRLGVALPPDLVPVLVVLLLGVTTDYSVFFLDGMRGYLAEGVPRVRAARLATAEVTPIVVAAGLIVAAATASLAVARTQLLQAFGPGLALTVLTALAVSVTLAPALTAVLGGVLFRPRRERPAPAQAVPAGTAGTAGSPGQPPGAPGGVRLRMARFAAERPMALLIAAACVAGLLAAAWGVRDLRLGSPLIRELPSSSSIVRASTAASDGFAPGILSPTEILVTGPGVTGQAAALARLQRELAAQPGVAELAGPASLPGIAAPLNPMLAASGTAARYVVVERTDPLDATAIARVQALQDDLPSLGRSAGLAGARFEVAGQTALTGDSINWIFADLGRVALAIVAATLLLLALFLGSLLAPVYLLAASVLAVFASLGLTMLICRVFLGTASLVYFVPFAAGVLLVALGSDYNVFVVGRIWDEAKRRPVRDAVAVAAPQASRAITTAGVALAASFATLAVIPLEQFRQLAIAMALGVILDAIAVRSLLVPALVAFFGRLGMWPGGGRSRGQSRA